MQCSRLVLVKDRRRSSNVSKQAESENVSQKEMNRISVLNANHLKAEMSTNDRKEYESKHVQTKWRHLLYTKLMIVLVLQCVCVYVGMYVCAKTSCMQLDKNK